MTTTTTTTCQDCGYNLPHHDLHCKAQKVTFRCPAHPPAGSGWTRKGYDDGRAGCEVCGERGSHVTPYTTATEQQQALEPITDDAGIDLLWDTFDHVEVLGRNLKPGMMILDSELDTVAAILDHRVTATRGSGAAAWLCFNTDHGNAQVIGQLSVHHLGLNHAFRVAAR